MKFLTLNTHSWMEEDAEGKFQTLKEQILKAQYDIICFQEVTQLQRRRASSRVENMPFLHVEDALLEARKASSSLLSITF